jgi:hypothetical protein
MSSGKAPKQPSSQTVTQTNIPAELLPYASQLVAKATALSEAPYVAYEGQRVAGFNPLQQQGMQSLQGMQPSSQIGQATGLAGLAGLRAAQGPEQYTGANVEQYMSPYMRNVVEQQQLGAIRDYQRELPGLASVATRVGGLGGTRQALVQAEAQRNLQDRLAGIQASGTQAAFENAQQQFNAQQAAGLNYLAQQLGAAGMLGELGSREYEQGMGITEAQMRAGEAARGIESEYLRSLYDEYAARQNFPYRNLGFLSDIIRGTPLTDATQTIYQAPGSMAGQIAGLGYGVGSLLGGK